VVPSDSTRSSGHNLKHRRVHLIFTVRLTGHWHRLPREVVQSPSLEIFKTSLDMVLGNRLSLSLLKHGVEPDGLQRCLPTSNSLWFCDKDTSSLSKSLFPFFNQIFTGYRCRRVYCYTIYSVFSCNTDKRILPIYSYTADIPFHANAS